MDLNQIVEALKILNSLSLKEQTGLKEQTEKKSIFSDFIGKYVLIRSRNEGVNAGYLVNADETGCVLRDARRLHYHEPAKKYTSWYEGVAKTGLSKESRVSEKTDKVIVEDYSITLCTEIAQKSIESFKTYEQN